MKTIKNIIAVLGVSLSLSLYGQSNNSNFYNISNRIIEDSSNFSVSRKTKEIPQEFFHNIKEEYNLRFRITNSGNKKVLNDYYCLFCSNKRWLVFVANSDRYIILHYVIARNNLWVNTVVCVKYNDKIVEKYLLSTGFCYDFSSLLKEIVNQNYKLKAIKKNYW